MWEMVCRCRITGLHCTLVAGITVKVYSPLAIQEAVEVLFFPPPNKACCLWDLALVESICDIRLFFRTSGAPMMIRLDWAQLSSVFRSLELPSTP